MPVAAEPEPGQEPRDDISVVAPKAERQAEPAPQETKPPEAEPPEAEPSEVHLEGPILPLLRKHL